MFYSSLAKIFTIISTLLFTASLSANPIKNGFNLGDSIVPADKILHGGPSKDGIPSIENPTFIPANEVDFLQENDYVLGITLNGISRAYPIKILNWHEIVNDAIAGTPIVVSYCPLCGTGMVYYSKVNGQVLKFGVSGLLYNSDMLLYDRQTQTLWSQILAKAVSGKWLNTKLKIVPTTYITWDTWKQQQPDTTVLSTQTGYQRNYSKSPYGNYDSNRDIYFPVTVKSKRYHPKERVLGISINGKHKAYPFIELGKSKKAKFVDSFAGRTLHIEFDAENRTGTIKGIQGRELTVTNSFWFAWYAFHPDSYVFSAK